MKQLLTILISLSGLAATCQTPDICAYSQHYVDSLNMLIQQRDNLIANMQVIDLSDSTNMGEFTLIKMSYEGDTLFCFDSKNYVRFVDFLGRPPTMQSWTTDSTSVDFVYQPSHVSLRVEKNDEIVIWLKEIKY